MFGNALHPTLELSLVLVIISTLFIACTAMIVQAGNDGKCTTVSKAGSNYHFAQGVLVMSVFVLVYGLGFLGLHLYEQYK